MKKLKTLFQEHISELSNVTWPTRNQATHVVIVVLVIVAIMSAFLTFFDYGLSVLFRLFS